MLQPSKKFRSLSEPGEGKDFSYVTPKAENIQKSRSIGLHQD